jgi:hypothetical protein
MDEIIKQVLLKNNMKIHEIEYNYKTFFSYFDNDKQDYYVLLFMGYDELIKLNEDGKSKLEFLINVVIEEDLRKKYLKKFDVNNLEYNISFILILNLEDETELILRELHKIEENYRVAKKYILPYKNNDFATLKEKISISEDIIYELNRIAIDYSNLLNNKNETWYKLLMSLFIKLPFLNYVPLGNNQQLRNIKNEIDNVLNEPQKVFTDKILNDYTEYSDVEEFLLTNNLFIDETDK